VVVAINYTQYEKSTLVDAKASLRNPFLTPLSALARVVDEDERGDGEREEGHRALKVDPRLVALLRLAIERVHDAVLMTLTTRSVRRAYARAGHKKIRSLSDISHLALWEVDEVAQGIAMRYTLAGGALGLLAGSLGTAGAIVDAPIALGLAVRCIDDIAMHYGFDPRTPSERAFVLDVFASSVGSDKKTSQERFEQLTALASKARRRWENANARGASLPLLFTIGRKIIGALSRRRGSRVVPALAATAIGGANAWLLAGVAEAAHAAYRERFMRRNARQIPRETST
jgi:hypothetical protein